MEVTLSIVCILSFTITLTASEFTPGCSFFNGQCVYKVKLGQTSQCDAAPQSIVSSNVNAGTGHLSGGGCTCTDVATVKNDVSSLKTTVSQLQQAMDMLYKQLNLTKTDLAQTTSQVQTATQNNSDLLSVLHSKEIELNNTNTELASVLHTASTEIQGLREQLQNASRDLAVCQGVVNPSGHTISPALTPDYTSFYCPFEVSSICGFRQDGSTYWQHSKGTLSTTTGPKEDHTYGTPSGYYMVLDAKNSAASSGTRVARLASKSFNPSKNYCIRFWYNMYGADVRDLNVYAKVNGGLGNPIFSRSGNQGPDWKMAEIELNDEYTASNFQIVLEAKTDATKQYHSSSYSHSYYSYKSENSNIAIDDFFAYNTTCSNVPECPPGSYKRMVSNTTKCVKFHTTPQDWFKASEICKEESALGHLIAVNDSQTENYIVQLIQSDIGLTAAGQSGYYIGANDEKSEGNFVWTDNGSPYSVSYTNWHSGQPNNVGSNQDCVLLEYPESGYEWGDVSCSTKHPFICEVSI